MNAYNGETNVARWSAMQREELLIEIIENNLVVIFLNLCGITTFGILSITSTFYNGFVFGRLVSYSWSAFGFQSIVNNVLPHSFEVVAIIIACALSFCGSADILNYLKNRHYRISFRFYAKQICICVLVVVFSAFMEAYVSIE